MAPDRALNIFGIIDQSSGQDLSRTQTSTTSSHQHRSSSLSANSASSGGQIDQTTRHGTATNVGGTRQPLSRPLSPPEPTSPPKTASGPPRSRGKLSISVRRTLSQKFRSTEALPNLTSPESMGSSTKSPPPVPPLDHSKTSFSALGNSSAPKRAQSERPSLPIQASFSRDASSMHVPMLSSLHPPTSFSASSTPASAGGHNPMTVYQTIHETGTKRMATLDYLRKVHHGNVFYFNTLHFSPATLSSVPSMALHKLGRRATGYMVLGYSLPAILDLNSGSALEYLKALSAILQEFEAYQNLSGYDSGGNSLGRGRMGQMFKSGMGLGNRTGKNRRSSAAAESLGVESHRALLGLPLSATETSSPQDMPSPINTSGHDFQHLLTPHLPFEPEFSTTFATLCDALIDTYARLLELVSGPDICGPSVSDAFVKADKTIRKLLVANIVREFDESTRSIVKSEAAGVGRLVLAGLM